MNSNTLQIINKIKSYIKSIENKNNIINFYLSNIKKVGNYFLDYNLQIFLKNKPLTSKFIFNSSIIINNDETLNIDIIKMNNINKIVKFNKYTNFYVGLKNTIKWYFNNEIFKY